jgi:hypothetical protein
MAKPKQLISEREGIMNKGRWMTLVPAYSRDYETAEAVLAHWNANKDFMIQDVSWRDAGRYVGRGEADDPKHDLQNVTFKIRYNKLGDFCLIARVGLGWGIINHEEEGVAGEAE